MLSLKISAVKHNKLKHYGWYILSIDITKLVFKTYFCQIISCFICYLNYKFWGAQVSELEKHLFISRGGTVLFVLSFRSAQEKCKNPKAYSDIEKNLVAQRMKYEAKYAFPMLGDFYVQQLEIFPT